MGDFKKLKVWQKAHNLAVQIHRIARSMRDSRHTSLRNQIIRAAESIPTNIVEGSRQSTNGDFARFLGYSLNSSSELEYHLMLSRDIGATPEGETSTLINDLTEVRKMLHGLIRRVKESPRLESRRGTRTPL